MNAPGSNEPFPRPPIPRLGVFGAGYPERVDIPAIVTARNIADVLGDANARELLQVLELPDEERLDLIAHLYQRDDGQALAEILSELELDPDDPTRLRLMGGLQAVLRGGSTGSSSD